MFDFILSNFYFYFYYFLFGKVGCPCLSRFLGFSFFRGEDLRSKGKFFWRGADLKRERANWLRG